MSKQILIKRRGFLAAAAGAVAGAIVRPSGPVVAASGDGDQGPLLLGSNNNLKAGPPASSNNVANISSVATVIEASPNYSNYDDAGGHFVFRADATKALGNINGLEGWASAGGDGVFGTSATGFGGHFTSTLGGAVNGVGATYGAVLNGATAALLLTPQGSGAPASGAHALGELLVDAHGDLYLCSAAGSPGTWVKVTKSFKTLPAPERFVDTRSNLGGVQGPVAAGTTKTFQMTARNGASGNPALQIPDGATSLVGNLTVIGGAGIPVGSYVTVWPSGSPPAVSNVNVGPSGVVANSFTVGLGSAGGHGTVSVFNQQVCDYILDVTGYWT